MALIAHSDIEYISVSVLDEGNEYLKLFAESRISSNLAGLGSTPVYGDVVPRIPGPQEVGPPKRLKMELNLSSGLLSACRYHP